jgi:diguanylate cyclase (GGDEF)-like protein
MDNPADRSQSSANPGFANRLQFAIAAFGLTAPVLTFLVAISGFVPSVKIAILVALSFVYFSICLWTLWQMRRPALSALSAEEQMISSFNAAEESEDFIDEKLAALEDAREFFGSSLKPADMFRLVASRVGEIVPFTAAVLFMRSANRDFLVARHSYGSNALLLENVEIPLETSLAGLALLSGEIESTAEILKEAALFPDGSLAGFVAAAAIPLSQEGDIFAVMQFFFAEPVKDFGELRERLEIIGGRLSPLFLGSLAYEKSLSSALTDPLTKLPNERAFFLVLENQLAESQRFRDERPLTVLAVDIRDFEEINRDYGHSTGDRVLSFAATGIISQLRRMDFLARSMNDEFLVVLPKASARTASEIIERIAKHFSENHIELSADEVVRIWLNFGWATFWQDGDTAGHLVNTARQRKQIAKLGDLSNVLKFPKEYVN